MDRSSFLRLFLIVGGVLLFMQFGWPKLTGSDGPRYQPLGKESLLAPLERTPEAHCSLQGERFRADLSTRGASLVSFSPEGSKYTVDGRPGSAAMDLVTTPALEARQPLRLDFRTVPETTTTLPQVDFDLIDWNLVAQSPRECVFSYEDENVALRKVVRANHRPFEIEMDLSVENRRSEKSVHRLAVETAAWRSEKEVEGGLGRQSPFLTQVECFHDNELIEKGSGDFAPKDFSKPEFVHGWFTKRGVISFAAVSNFYFAQALVPLAGPPGLAQSCELQIEDRWNHKAFTAKKDDPNAGALYRARLAWEPQELAPGDKANYQVLHFLGPKERDVLAAAAGGTHHVSDLIHLGRFAVIARVLVSFLIWCHTTLGSWGLAIIALTLTVRLVLFPLTWKTIQSGAKMRQMKPEMDALTKKYADDPQQKQLATMELWKKHKVNPLAGCLPMVAQMPVWFALYTALQTAAELYHTPFLWFRDLSAPDTYRLGTWDLPFLLPLLLGGITFLQQRVMPQQMDPMQQKMMSYIMPAVFTAMMLFLPAGLGVYMLTNSVLGILQQLAVERYYDSRSGGKGGGIGVKEKKTTGSGASALMAPQASNQR